MSLNAEMVVDCRNIHGEGIIWNPGDQKIWWTDITGKRLWSFDPASGTSRSIETPNRVCCLAPRRSGGLILALDDGLAFSREGTEIERFHDFEPDLPQTRLNDGRTDRTGRFIVGGMDEVSGKAISSVLRVDADGTVATIIRGVAISNSICFSPDGNVLYFTDTPTGRIMAFPYDQKSGSVGESRTFATVVGGGAPDGSCVDSEGGVWNAEWGGKRVVRYTQEGKVDVIVDLPVSNVTCCAFGGADLGTLYITTSRLGLDDRQLADQPGAGGLFAISPSFRGIADAEFLG